MSSDKKSHSINYGEMLFKAFMSLMKGAILSLGRFFKREIPLQARWIIGVSNSFDLLTTRWDKWLKIACIVLITIVLCIPLFFWGMLRAIFIPDSH